MSLRLATTIVLLVGAGFVATLAHATAPGKDGRIAFVRYRFSDKPLWAEIWVANPDGTRERRITQTQRGYIDEAPDWAPDGSRIVFTRCPPHDRPCEIWSVKPDGSGQRRLSPHCPPGGKFPECVWDGSPAYSPDGKHIVFERDSGRFDVKRGRPYSAAIMVADTNLTHAHRVAWFGPYHAGPNPDHPTWAPDGKQIAFTTDASNRHAIYVVNVDGTGLHRVTPWKLRAGGGWEGIDWSPDGGLILFRTQPFDGEGSAGGNLYTIRPTGTGLRQLTHFDAYNQDAGALEAGSFSPDGGSIVFSTDQDAVEEPSGNNLPDVFVMSTDGTDVRPVTRTRYWDGSADWGPG